jgi:coenzyme F420-reducing hydrogenase alpha subunit
VSVAKKEKHAKSLYEESYDKSCHIFEIGKNLTVRCGCFDTYAEAKKHQKNVAQEYKKSYIVTTYRSRFAKFNEKKSKHARR